MRRIERNQDAIMLLGVTLFLMGLECLRMSLTGGVPMPPETHGTAMYQTPAEAWALIVLAQSGALILGAKIGCPPLVAAAGLFGGLLYLALFTMADQAALGSLVSRGSAVFGVLNTAAAAAAFLDMLAGWLERQMQTAIQWIEDQRKGDE